MSMDFQQARFNMVEQQIRPWDVLDQDILDALQAIPRDAFVPDEFRLLAYSDIRIPIGYGQSMMNPKVEARLLQAVKPAATDRVLEIGTGSGYLTALLAHFARNVQSCEIHAELATAAQRKFRARGWSNINVVHQDGLLGMPERGPFDVIAVTGALAARSPELEAQLAPGGRLVVITGQGHAMEALLVTRQPDGSCSDVVLFETELEPLLGAEPPSRFAF